MIGPLSRSSTKAHAQRHACIATLFHGPVLLLKAKGSSCKASPDCSGDPTLHCLQLLLAKSNGLAAQSDSGEDSPLLVRGMTLGAEASQVEDIVRQHMAALSGSPLLTTIPIDAMLVASLSILLHGMP